MTNRRPAECIFTKLTGLSPGCCQRLISAPWIRSPGPAANGRASLGAADAGEVVKGKESMTQAENVAMNFLANIYFSMMTTEIPNTSLITLANWGAIRRRASR